MGYLKQEMANDKKNMLSEVIFKERENLKKTNPEKFKNIQKEVDKLWRGQERAAMEEQKLHYKKRLNKVEFGNVKGYSADKLAENSYLMEDLDGNAIAHTDFNPEKAWPNLTPWDAKLKEQMVTEELKRRIAEIEQFETDIKIEKDALEGGRLPDTPDSGQRGHRRMSSDELWMSDGKMGDGKIRGTESTPRSRRTALNKWQKDLYDTGGAGDSDLFKDQATLEKAWAGTGLGNSDVEESSTKVSRIKGKADISYSASVNNAGAIEIMPRTVDTQLIQELTEKYTAKGLNTTPSYKLGEAIRKEGFIEKYTRTEPTGGPMQQRGATGARMTYSEADILKDIEKGDIAKHVETLAGGQMDRDTMRSAIFDSIAEARAKAKVEKGVDLNAEDIKRLPFGGKKISDSTAKNLLESINTNKIDERDHRKVKFSGSGKLDSITPSVLNEPPDVDGKLLEKFDAKYQGGKGGKIINSGGEEVGTQLRRRSGEGSAESVVYEDSKKGVVRKYGKPYQGAFEGQEWEFFNDRIRSPEGIGNNAKLAGAGFEESRLVGYYDYSPPNSDRVFPQPVFEQRLLDSKDGWAIPTEEEISTHMKDRKYIDISDEHSKNRWLHSDGSHIASDIDPDNVRINKNTGEVKIIDAAVQTPTDNHKEIARAHREKIARMREMSHDISKPTGQRGFLLPNAPEFSAGEFSMSEIRDSNGKIIKEAGVWGDEMPEGRRAVAMKRWNEVKEAEALAKAERGWGKKALDWVDDGPYEAERKARLRQDQWDKMSDQQKARLKGTIDDPTRPPVLGDDKPGKISQRLNTNLTGPHKGNPGRSFSKIRDAYNASHGKNFTILGKTGSRFAAAGSVLAEPIAMALQSASAFNNLSDMQASQAMNEMGMMDGDRRHEAETSASVGWSASKEFAAPVWRDSATMNQSSIDAKAMEEGGAMDRLGLRERMTKADQQSAQYSLRNAGESVLGDNRAGGVAQSVINAAAFTADVARDMRLQGVGTAASIAVGVGDVHSWTTDKLSTPVSWIGRKLGIYNEGKVPNFEDAVKREKHNLAKRGIDADVYPFTHPSIVSNDWNMGIANTFDEPPEEGGGRIGVERAMRMGRNPSTHGLASGGFVPSFGGKPGAFAAQQKRLAERRAAKLEANGGISGWSGFWSGANMLRRMATPDFLLTEEGERQKNADTDTLAFSKLQKDAVAGDKQAVQALGGPQNVDSEAAELFGDASVIGNLGPNALTGIGRNAGMVEAVITARTAQAVYGTDSFEYKHAKKIEDDVRGGYAKGQDQSHSPLLAQHQQQNYDGFARGASGTIKVATALLVPGGNIARTAKVATGTGQAAVQTTAAARGLHTAKTAFQASRPGQALSKAAGSPVGKTLLQSRPLGGTRLNTAASNLASKTLPGKLGQKVPLNLGEGAKLAMLGGVMDHDKTGEFSMQGALMFPLIAALGGAAGGAAFRSTLGAGPVKQALATATSASAGGVGAMTSIREIEAALGSEHAEGYLFNSKDRMELFKEDLAYTMLFTGLGMGQMRTQRSVPKEKQAEFDAMMEKSRQNETINPEIAKGLREKANEMRIGPFEAKSDLIETSKDAKARVEASISMQERINEALAKIEVRRKAAADKGLRTKQQAAQKGRIASPKEMRARLNQRQAEEMEVSEVLFDPKTLEMQTVSGEAVGLAKESSFQMPTVEAVKAMDVSARAAGVSGKTGKQQTTKSLAFARQKVMSEAKEGTMKDVTSEQLGEMLSEKMSNLIKNAKDAQLKQYSEEGGFDQLRSDAMESLKAEQGLRTKQKRLTATQVIKGQDAGHSLKNLRDEGYDPAQMTLDEVQTARGKQTKVEKNEKSALDIFNQREAVLAENPYFDPAQFKEMGLGMDAGMKHQALLEQTMGQKSKARIPAPGEIGSEPQLEKKLKVRRNNINEQVEQAKAAADASANAARAQAERQATEAGTLRTDQKQLSGESEAMYARRQKRLEEKRKLARKLPDVKAGQQVGSLVSGIASLKDKSTKKTQRFRDAYDRGYNPKRAPSTTTKGKTLPGKAPAPEGQVSIENQPKFKEFQQKARDARKAGDNKAANQFTTQANKLRRPAGTKGGGQTPGETFFEAAGQGRRMTGGGPKGTGINPQAMKGFKPDTIAGVGGKFVGGQLGKMDVARKYAGSTATQKAELQKTPSKVPGREGGTGGAGIMTEVGMGLGKTDAFNRLMEEGNAPAAYAALRGRQALPSTGKGEAKEGRLSQPLKPGEGLIANLLPEVMTARTRFDAAQANAKKPRADQKPTITGARGLPEFAGRVKGKTSRIKQLIAEGKFEAAGAAARGGGFAEKQLVMAGTKEARFQAAAMEARKPARQKQSPKKGDQRASALRLSKGGASFGRSQRVYDLALTNPEAARTMVGKSVGKQSLKDNMAYDLAMRAKKERADTLMLQRARSGPSRAALLTGKKGATEKDVRKDAERRAGQELTKEGGGSNLSRNFVQDFRPAPKVETGPRIEPLGAQLGQNLSGTMGLGGGQLGLGGAELPPQGPAHRTPPARPSGGPDTPIKRVVDAVNPAGGKTKFEPTVTRGGGKVKTVKEIKAEQQKRTEQVNKFKQKSKDLIGAGVQKAKDVIGGTSIDRFGKKVVEKGKGVIESVQKEIGIQKEGRRIQNEIDSYKEAGMTDAEARARVAGEEPPTVEAAKPEKDVKKTDREATERQQGEDFVKREEARQKKEREDTAPEIKKTWRDNVKSGIEAVKNVIAKQRGKLDRSQQMTGANTESLAEPIKGSGDIAKSRPGNLHVNLLKLVRGAAVLKLRAKLHHLNRRSQESPEE